MIKQLQKTDRQTDGQTGRQTQNGGMETQSPLKYLRLCPDGIDCLKRLNICFALISLWGQLGYLAFI